MTKLTEESSFGLRLAAAFALMRKRSLVARQNFSCCGSCAALKMGRWLTKAAHANKAGGVFYDAQQHTAYLSGRLFLLQFGARLQPDGSGAPDVDTEAVGRVAVACLQECFIQTEWDGSAHTCIVVLQPKPCWA